MERQYLRDRHGLIIGSREERGDRILGFDATGRIVGWYLLSDGRTRDADGMIVGTGDLLSSLITSRL
jgi:hypothetical protein